MGQAYTPGLKVIPHTPWQCARRLPVEGEVLVKTGQRVHATDVIARAAMPGDVFPVHLSRLLGVSPGQLPSLMLKQVGDPVVTGEPLARTRGIFGLFAREVLAEHDGTIESISTVTGQVIVRGKPLAVELKAYLSGEVKEVFPNSGARVAAPVSIVQGIFGVGGETYGALTPVCASPDEPLSAEKIDAKHRGQILVGGARITAEAVARARQVGVAALISGGLDDQDLLQILGYDLGVAITGNENLGLTVIVTEGFGDIAMARRTFDLLTGHRGKFAACNGATQIRAGVMRPEVIVPLIGSGKDDTAESGGDEDEGALRVGAPVRVIRDPWFGELGTVAELPHAPQMLDSGSKARVLVVRRADGSRLSVPRANVERIEE